MELSDYEKREWDRLQARKHAAPGRRARLLVPKPVRERAARAAASAADRARRVPGSDVVGSAYTAAAGGAGKALSRSVQATLSEDRVLAAFRRRDVPVQQLTDLAGIDLRSIDQVAQLSRLKHKYAGAALVEGGLAGLMMSGGVAGAAAGGVFGLGAGAAPGLGAVAATMAGDTAAVLALSARVVAHTAMYYGFDPARPEEELFLMSVIGLGMTTGQAAKTSAFADLHQLTGLLAKKATWDKLNEKTLTKIVQRFAARFGERVTQRKLGQFVPVAGVLIGAGLNYQLMDSIADAADLAYRERYLRSKSGNLEGPGTEPAEAAPNDGEVRLDVLGIVREELDDECL